MGDTAQDQNSGPVAPGALETSPRWRIRSFAAHRGRITVAQRRAYEELRPRLAVPYQAQLIDPVAIFGRGAPLVLEIGFGMGETTAAIAQRHPQIDFVAVDVFPGGVGALARRLYEAQLRNVRIIEHDAVEVVEKMIGPASLHAVHVFFPDPWPKVRHHKRRLIAQPFVGTLAERLRSGGVLHCATDWENYAQQMLEVLSQEPRLRNLHCGYAAQARSPWCERPTTKFQARGARLGHGVWDLVFERR
ncbi:MAG TPA: tRNA (guanosine(46)-N7)-methyltransferase TrmB [Burkholderiaceae bacterium]|nr:tRNA (guanosine(46)-N7)-methyltransferase TrmB [Burkholderiaceae bacterium]